MTPHRDTIRKQLGITTPSYRDMMRATLRERFDAARHIAHFSQEPKQKAWAIAQMAGIRREIAHLDTWSRDYV